MAEYIKHTCKDCIHFKICNDYEYLIGREIKVACPDFKSTEDVVPRSEVEKIFDKYGNYNFPTEPKENFNNTVVTGNKESTDFYCSFTQSKIQNCPIQDEIEKAKQEVAKQIIDDLCGIFDYWRQDDCIRESSAIILAIADFKKKYIGE